LEADRALLEAQLAHANAHIDTVERQLSGMRRQLAGLLADEGSVGGDGGGGSPEDRTDRAQQGAMVLWSNGGSSGSAQGSDVRAERCRADMPGLLRALTASSQGANGGLWSVGSDCEALRIMN
jgi:hypothetical protein